MRSLNLLIVALFCLSAFAGTARAAGQATVSATAQPTTLKPGESGVIRVQMTVRPGLHAQSHTPSSEDYIPFEIKPDATAGVTFGEIKYPPGEDHQYGDLGKLNVYTGTATFDVPFTLAPSAVPGPLEMGGKVTYQACDATTCFPPQKPKFTVTISVAGGPATAPTTQQASAAQSPALQSTATPPTPPDSAPPAQQSSAPAATTAETAATPASRQSTPPDTSAFGLTLADQSAGVVFGAALLVGILFNAVPCVLPVVPLKIAGFYEAAQHSRGRCFALGAAFSAGVIGSFVVLAVFVVGLRAISWGQQFQNPYFTAAIVVVLVAMAASQFGLFTVNLPMAAYGFSPKHDTYFGNVLFGILTAALSTPCTIGPFAGLLAWALSKPAAIGGTAIVFVGVGMALPYLVLSAFPQVVRRFPRTGPLGEIIKQTLAFLVLATAVYFARPFLGRINESVFWWMLFAFIPVAGVFLIVRTAAAFKTVRALVIPTIVSLLVIAPAAVLADKLASQPYTWQAFSETSLADAIRTGQPVVIDFTADWCGNCHWLEANTLKDRDIIAIVKQRQILMLKADVTRDDGPGKPLLDKLSPAGAIPLTAVYLPGQTEPKLLTGIYNVRDLIEALTPKADPAAAS